MRTRAVCWRRLGAIWAVVLAMGAGWCEDATAGATGIDTSGALRCHVRGANVLLEWEVQFIEPIRGFVIVRDGAPIAALEPEAKRYWDVGVAPGGHTYTLLAVDFLGDEIVVGRCRVVVEDQGLECHVEGREVLLSWGPPLTAAGVSVVPEQYVIVRNGQIIDRVPGNVFAYVDTVPSAGTYRYAVFGLSGDVLFLVGTCSVVVEDVGLVCTVEGDTVHLDWSNVPLPAIQIDFFVIFRDGHPIARTRQLEYWDTPGPCEHTYAVVAIIHVSPNPQPIDTRDIDSVSSNIPDILIGRCRVVVEGRVSPPAELSCRVGPKLQTEDDPDTTDDTGAIVPALPAVHLQWENTDDYSQLVVARNGVPVARLPGDAERYQDCPRSFGRFEYAVIGFIGSCRSPSANCEVVIEPPEVPPPRDLTCEVISAVPGATNADIVAVVALSWVNPIRYDALILSRDNAFLIRLPGDATGYRDVDPPSGVHVYSLVGVKNDQRSEVVRCEVEVPPRIVPPVRELTCVGREDTAFLHWENGADYDAIAIIRSDGEAYRLVGDATSFEDRGLAPGVYSYRVHGVLDGRLSPPASCEVVIEGPGPRNLLYFSSGLFQDTGGAEAPVSPRGRISCMASNHDPIQGWSFGVQSDPRFIVPAATDLVGTATAGLNDGGGPKFIQVSVMREGVTMAVIVDDMDLTDTLPPATNHRLLNIRYEEGPEAEPGGEYPVRYSDGLGSPPVSILYVVRGMGVVPATLPGVVRLPLSLPFFLRADANGDNKLDLSDPMFILNWLFAAGPEPRCLESADGNGDKKTDIADPIYILQHRFSGGPPPPAPYPTCGSGPIFLGCDDPTCPQPL